MTRRSQRGFTLIELMVALIVSSLLVGMILAIFSRMSSAYRGQQQIAGVQQVLSAARAQIEFDAKQAGFGMAQGFMFSDGLLHTPVRINNSNAGPDRVAFFYGDSSTQAAVLSLPGAWTSLFTVTVDSVAGFKADDIVLLSTADLTSQQGLVAGSDANIAKFTACTLQINAVFPATQRISFKSAAPWGRPNNTHCTAPQAGTMVYKFVAHAYRIDTSTAARAAVGPLQMSSTGGLLGTDVWDDQAFGFTDLQTSLQVYDRNRDPTDTPDPDTDGERDWYSGDLQETLLTANGGAGVPGNDGYLQISISLVARTDRDVEGISTQQTPMLTDLANTTNNTIGDRAAINLPSAPPWLADPALQGARIYRYTTFQVDFRNLGVGR